MKGENVERFGILIKEGVPIKKQAIKKEKIVSLLTNQTEEFRQILKKITSDDFEAKYHFMQIAEDHEYLHPGQLIVMFRLAGIDFPTNFKKAWDL